MAGRLRLITFDACNTLFHVRGSPGELYSNVAARFGVEIKPKALNDSFKDSFRDFYQTLPNFGAHSAKTGEKWWQGVVGQTFRSAGYHDEANLARISSALYKEFSTPSYWQVYPETFFVLERLKNRNYHLAVVSNFDERLDVILESLHLKEYFTFIVCSFDIGICKPSPEVFQLVLSHFDVKAEEALHVGDNVNLDYKPAIELGMRSLIVNRFSKDYSKDSVDTNHIIQDLTHLQILCN